MAKSPRLSTICNHHFAVGKVITSYYPSLQMTVHTKALKCRCCGHTRIVSTDEILLTLATQTHHVRAPSERSEDKATK